MASVASTRFVLKVTDLSTGRYETLANLRPTRGTHRCTRNVAVYECLSYGPDGAVKRARKKVTLHGTAFAHKRQGADALLLTNDHVASWPLVTDAQHPVEDVSPGCKKISESLTLVDDEHDNYGHHDIAVTRVVTDPELDVAILKTHADLHIMPWKIGSKRGLKVYDRASLDSDAAAQAARLLDALRADVAGHLAYVGPTRGPDRAETNPGRRGTLPAGRCRSSPGQCRAPTDRAFFKAVSTVAGLVARDSPTQPRPQRSIVKGSTVRNARCDDL